MIQLKNYEEAVSYIETIPKFTKKHSLSHTKDCLKRLKVVFQEEKLIHVAGTNGKGSVCAFLEGILRSEKKRVGVFTSPHLVSMRERIRIQGESISKEDFFSAFLQVYELSKELEREGKGHPSYFEFLFLMGALAFQKAKLEYLIFEVGLGGRLDATNGLERYDLSIVTSIGLDHQQFLGNQISDIAREKAGILREGGFVLFDGSNEEAREVILEEIHKKNCAYHMVSKKDMKFQGIEGNKVAFLRANAYDEGIYKIQSKGLYQGRNLELALQAATYLLQGEIKERARWKKALEQVVWQGRMETIGEDLIVDGAHNLPAVLGFLESLSAFSKDLEESVLIFAVVEDKDYSEMIQAFTKFGRFKAFVVTEVEGERKVPRKRLEELFRKESSCPVFGSQSVEEAIQIGRRERGERGTIYVVGSLYLVGEIKKWMAGGKDCD